jgi:hypothetical protein
VLARFAITLPLQPLVAVKAEDGGADAKKRKER